MSDQGRELPERQAVLKVLRHDHVAWDGWQGFRDDLVDRVLAYAAAREEKGRREALTEFGGVVVAKLREPPEAGGDPVIVQYLDNLEYSMARWVENEMKARLPAASQPGGAP